MSSLESRLAELERRLGPVVAQRTAEQKTEALKQRARQRMRRDVGKHAPEQLREAERLYQVANKDWRSNDARASLREMIEKYPDVNRTGCAVLYLGQMAADPQEQEQYLRTAVEEHGDCFYGNGVQVGGFGRYLLGMYYLQHDQPEKARPLFDQLRRDYPDAIDHRRRVLAELIPTAEAQGAAGKVKGEKSDPGASGVENGAADEPAVRDVDAEQPGVKTDVDAAR